MYVTCWKKYYSLHFVPLTHYYNYFICLLYKLYIQGMISDMPLPKIPRHGHRVGMFLGAWCVAGGRGLAVPSWRMLSQRQRKEALLKRSLFHRSIIWHAKSYPLKGFLTFKFRKKFIFFFFISIHAWSNLHQLRLWLTLLSLKKCPSNNWFNYPHISIKISMTNKICKRNLEYTMMNCGLVNHFLSVAFSNAFKLLSCRRYQALHWVKGSKSNAAKRGTFFSKRLRNLEACHLTNS